MESASALDQEPGPAGRRTIGGPARTPRRARAPPRRRPGVVVRHAESSSSDRKKLRRVQRNPESRSPPHRPCSTHARLPGRRRAGAGQRIDVEVERHPAPVAPRLDGHHDAEHRRDAERVDRAARVARPPSGEDHLEVVRLGGERVRQADRVAVQPDQVRRVERGHPGPDGVGRQVRQRRDHRFEGDRSTAARRTRARSRGGRGRPAAPGEPPTPPSARA